MAHIALLTNIPAPYREKMHELLYSYLTGEYCVIYCAERESDRAWTFRYGHYKKSIISQIPSSSKHNNPEIWKILSSLDPKVVIIMGFYPSMLYGYLWSLIKGRKLIVFTDGTLKSESHLSRIHQLVRKVVFIKASAFIGPSNGAIQLYERYGIKREKFFRTFLCVENERFISHSTEQKKYDLMFSGQFIDRKMPFFFIEVATLVKAKRGRCHVLLLGNGPLKEQMIRTLEQNGLSYDLPGYISQEELPAYYSKAKLFLFPTQNDPWGVVANEAMASGMPVITCENAGVANDLVLDNENGYILPLEPLVWRDKIDNILDSPTEYDRLSANAIQHVKKYNSDNAAKGIMDAVAFALRK